MLSPMRAAGAFMVSRAGGAGSRLHLGVTEQLADCRQGLPGASRNFRGIASVRLSGDGGDVPGPTQVCDGDGGQVTSVPHAPLLRYRNRHDQARPYIRDGRARLISGKATSSASARISMAMNGVTPANTSSSLSGIGEALRTT